MIIVENVLNRLGKLIILLLLLMSCASKNILKPRNLVKYNYCNEYLNSPEMYDSACLCITKYKLEFPTANVVSGELYKNGEVEPSSGFSIIETFKIEQQFITDFRDIMKDTSNFIWGEPGTPYIDYIILFRDSTGLVINKAEISFDRYLITEPQLGTIKWGGVSNKGVSMFQNLINRYTKSNRQQ